MKLSKKERNLSIILGIILLLWGYHKFIILPQSNKLKIKQEYKTHYKNELVRAQTIADSEKEITNKLIDVNDEMDKLSRMYFSEINQSRFILLIDELLEGTDLFIENISFSPKKTGSIGDVSTEIMSVTLPYEGEYPSLLLFLKRIRKHVPKIIIQNIGISIKRGKLLSGIILLDFYSLPDFVNDIPTAYLFDSSETNPSPFYSFEDNFIVDDEYIGSEYNESCSEINLDNVKIIFDSPRVLVEGFDDKVLNFIPSHPSIKGEIATNKNSKQGTGSLGLCYSYPPIQDEKHVHIILDSKETVIFKQPESIGLWVYSYDMTEENVGIRIKDKEGKSHDLNLYEGIDWIGWKHLKVDIPQDKFTFPVEIGRIMIHIKSSEHGKSTLLFDALEAFYTTDIPVVDENNVGNYKLYDVQVGDTLNSISKFFYNDTSYKDIIKKYNGIENDSNLKPGKTIIIPNIQKEMFLTQ